MTDLANMAKMADLKRFSQDFDEIDKLTRMIIRFLTGFLQP